ncbi:hypothetical protein HQ36_02030 [Porphyromonas gingivicanis]|uniref:Uncharacterized protein n=1 Tax=Porphyromonas gingivicanis TaxID=266762 RepID=A0A0A2G7S8_9PORP|nr:hypothetical protein [Porphyromonas gingivicanis]KGN98415.1 hypothetical protein HQ36_02030 [Porphyromonas gingivicanis]
MVITLQISATPELLGALNQLTEALTGGVPRTETQPTPVATKTKNAQAEVTLAESASSETKTVPEEEEQTQTAEKTKEYSEVDVREAMDRTRKRIEGENYKEQTDSELYKKWHRRLTAFFKDVAVALGAEKPSTLPDSESRAKFIACCDAVCVKNDELVENAKVWEVHTHY